MAEAHGHDENCSICALFGRSEEVIWSDDHWVATRIVDVPTWLMIGTRRHAEGSWGLSDAEAASLGPALRDLSGALKTVTGAERVHIAAQGENALHFHYMLMARRPGEAPVFDSAEIGKRQPGLVDAAEAKAVGDRIRDLMA